MPHAFYFELIECVRFSFDYNSFELKLDLNLELNMIIGKSIFKDQLYQAKTQPAYSFFWLG
jgi:hypothetical protein